MNYSVSLEAWTLTLTKKIARSMDKGQPFGFRKCLELGDVCLDRHKFLDRKPGSGHVTTADCQHVALKTNVVIL